MRSKGMDILKDYFSNKSVILGWSGGASFFSSASLESSARYAGIVDYDLVEYCDAVL